MVPPAVQRQTETPAPGPLVPVSNTSSHMRLGISLPPILVLLAVLGLPGCSPKPRLDPGPDLVATADLVRADSLVARGCYTCLQEAVTIYERLSAAGTAPAAESRAIDVLLLLALRERELGLSHGRALEQAAALAALQPAPFDIGVFLTVAGVQAWHGSGVSKERIDESMRPLRRMAVSWQAWRSQLLPGGSGDLLRASYLLSLECAADGLLRDAGLDAWTPPAGAPQLLRFRAAVCPASFDGEALRSLLESDPRFAEIHFFLGERALAQGTLRTAERHLLEAVAAIPTLAAAHLTLGHVYLAMEDIDAAFDAYHRVNAAVQGQREAMLGEVKSLSYLGRHHEAVAILDDMERLGTWYMGEVFYWRAWNRHRLGQYDAANDDVLASRSRLPMDGQVDKLAGFIALARNEVPRAESEFRAAVAHVEGRGGSDCESTYYLGSAQVMQRKWAEAAPNFEKAEPCYEGARHALAKRMEMIANSDLPDARKARLLAAKEREMAGARLQEARSSFNAAVAHFNRGEGAAARPFAERAASHPALAEQAKALLDRIGKSGPAPAP